MNPFAGTVNQVFSALTIAGDAFIALILIAFLMKYFGRNSRWVDMLADKGLWLAFLTALTATLVSLFYSEIVGFEPCKFCWLQRIFMYPQVFLLGMALWKKDRRIADYSIVLSIIGAAIAGYQWLLELGVTSAPCAATAVSCSKIYFQSFGYVTISVMGLTAFLLMIGFITAVKVSKKNSD